MIRHVRDTFNADNKEIFEGKSIQWELNIGMPSESIGDEHRKKFYTEITAFAWKISFYDKPLYHGRIMELILTLEDSKVIINALPESSALFVSYQHSINYQEGHYILIDIGAGTTDINYMIVHDVENSTNVTEVVRSVKPYGTAMLIKNLENVYEKQSNWQRCQVFPNINELQTLFNDGAGDIKLVVDSYLEQHYLKQLKDASTQARTRDTHFDRENLRSGNLPYHFFLTGGGSNIEYYVSKTMRFRRHNEQFHLSQKEFPYIQFQGREILKNTNIRLLVAYGLSWHEADYPIQVDDVPHLRSSTDLRDSGMNPSIIGPEQM